MKKTLIMKLAKIIAKFEEIATDKAVLTLDGALEVGVEAFVEGEEGYEPAPDGEYEAEDKVIVIAEGKVAEIREKEALAEEEAPAEEPAEEEMAEEEPAEEPAPEVDAKDAEIARLQAQIEELNNIIAEKDEEIGRLKAEIESLNKPVEEPVEMKKTVKEDSISDNKALKYFK